MRRRLHGLTVEVGGPLGAALLDDLLAALPAGDPAAPPDLVVHLAPAAGPPSSEGEPAFFHGVVQARAVAGALVLSDGASTARVAADGARVDLSVAPASLADRHTFEHVLALVALVVALRHRGLFHLHAAALALPDGRAALVAGGAGAGKSTLTLALLEHGLAYLGDDAAFLAAGPAGVQVLSFPRPFHVAPQTARMIPRLLPLLGDRYAVGDKRRLDPRVAFPGRERATAGPPALVLLPEVSGRPRTEAEEVPSAVALGALIESSALVMVDGLPGADRQLALLAAVAEGARCIKATLGRDLLERPADVASALLAEGLLCPR